MVGFSYSTRDIYLRSTAIRVGIISEFLLLFLILYIILRVDLIELGRSCLFAFVSDLFYK